MNKPNLKYVENPRAAEDYRNGTWMKKIASDAEEKMKSCKQNKKKPKKRSEDLGNFKKWIVHKLGMISS